MTMNPPNCPICRTPMPEIIHESEYFITYRCENVQLLVDKRRTTDFCEVPEL